MTDSDGTRRQPGDNRRLAESVQVAGDLLARFNDGLADLARAWTDTRGHHYREHFAGPMAQNLAELARTIMEVDREVGAINRTISEQENELRPRPRHVGGLQHDARPRRDGGVERDSGSRDVANDWNE